jgi:hypothetical protein
LTIKNAIKKNTHDHISKIFMSCFFVFLISTPAIAEETYNELPMDKVYQGPIHYPDFNGREKNIADYSVKIIDEMGSGPNFAGHFTIVELGCGTDCRFAFIADLATGKVYDFPYGGEVFNALSLDYKVKSNELTVRWATTADPAADRLCVIQNLEWNGEKFLINGTSSIEKDTCG